MSNARTDVNTVAAIFYGALLYLAALAGNNVSAGHFGFGTLSAIAPIMLFHFISGVLAIGGPSPTRPTRPGVYLLAAATTLLSAVGAVALTMVVPLWMPLKPALYIVFTTWIASAALAACLHAHAGNGYRDGLQTKPDSLTPK